VRGGGERLGEGETRQSHELVRRMVERMVERYQRPEHKNKIVETQEQT